MDVDKFFRDLGISMHSCNLCHQHPNFAKYPKSIQETIELAGQLSARVK